MKKLISISLLFTNILFSCFVYANDEPTDFIEFYVNEVFVPSRLGALKLYRDSNGFHVLKDNKIYAVKNCFCDPILHTMSRQQLEVFLGRDTLKIPLITLDEFEKANLKNRDKLVSQLFGRGYISVNQMKDGTYILHAKIRRANNGYPIRLGMAIGSFVGMSAGQFIGAFIAEKYIHNNRNNRDLSALVIEMTAGPLVGTPIGAIIGGAIGVGVVYMINNTITQNQIDPDISFLN
jgi:hypothetical protein